jgi:hypothetical protein
MDFGKYAIVKNARYHLANEPDWWWEFKPITAGDEVAMTIFIQQGRVDKDAEGKTILVPHPYQSIAMREVALSFGNTNIPLNEKSDKPILTPSSSIDEIEAVLKQMPHELFKEIWEALGDAYPFWGPAKPEGSKEKA